MYTMQQTFCLNFTIQILVLLIFIPILPLDTCRQNYHLPTGFFFSPPNLSVFLTSLLYRGIKSQHSERLLQINSKMSLLTARVYWDTNATKAFWRYTVFCLLSRTAFEILHYLLSPCSLLPAGLCCSLHPRSFTTARHLWPKHYLNINHLTNRHD